jgi:hypothetical protein
MIISLDGISKNFIYDSQKSVGGKKKEKILNKNKKVKKKKKIFVEEIHAKGWNVSNKSCCWLSNI